MVVSKSVFEKRKPLPGVDPGLQAFVNCSGSGADATAVTCRVLTQTLAGFAQDRKTLLMKPDNHFAPLCAVIPENKDQLLAPSAGKQSLNLASRRAAIADFFGCQQHESGVISTPDRGACISSF
jgi:hypothetical protein